MSLFSWSKKNKNLEVKKDTKKAEEVKEQAVSETIAVVKTEEDNQNNKNSWFQKIKQGLSKSSSKINDGLKDIFLKRKIDKETIEELEELLITADFGVKTAAKVVSVLKDDKFVKEATITDIKLALSEKIEKILEPFAAPLLQNFINTPHVILVCGVNGSGKTTTIGKLACKYAKEGKKVMIAACDTFRAAAVEQMKVWAERANVPIITGAENADPASVAYLAYTKAKAENIDILFIDTAGRLQNKKNLMEQLLKITNTLKKISDDTPQETLIVLDATTGQNATSQVKIFKEMVNLSGIIITKLDGTAKGGIAVSLAEDFALPIHYIGVGETIDDLEKFDAKIFALSLVGLD